MRKDMPRVIVTRPRIVDSFCRKGRATPFEELPTKLGMRRSVQERGGYKMLNEHLAPLRRYLESQVGQPWDKVFSEIASVLRVDSVVQQHVRDHIEDFVETRPRPSVKTTYLLDGSTVKRQTLWYQPLYVDLRDGILKRTIDHPEAKRRRRQKAERLMRKDPVDRVELAEDRQLRRIEGIWYMVTLSPLPEPKYRVVPIIRRISLKGHPRRGRTVDIEIVERHLLTPPVIDAVTGASMLVGPTIDNERERAAYRRQYPDRRYAVAKRQLSKSEMRYHGLVNDPR